MTENKTKIPCTVNLSQLFITAVVNKVKRKSANFDIAFRFAH